MSPSSSPTMDPTSTQATAHNAIGVAIALYSQSIDLATTPNHQLVHRETAKVLLAWQASVFLSFPNLDSPLPATSAAKTALFAHICDVLSGLIAFRLASETTPQMKEALEFLASQGKEDIESIDPLDFLPSELAEGFRLLANDIGGQGQPTLAEVCGTCLCYAITGLRALESVLYLLRQEELRGAGVECRVKAMLMHAREARMGLHMSRRE